MSHQSDQTHSTNHDHTYVERTEKRGGGTGIALLVGGLVVAVGVLFWAIYGGLDATSTTGSDVNVDVEGSESAVDDAAGAVEDAAGAVEDAADSTAGAANEAAADAEAAADEVAAETEQAADDAAN